MSLFWCSRYRLLQTSRGRRYGVIKWVYLQNLLATLFLDVILGPENSSKSFFEKFSFLAVSTPNYKSGPIMGCGDKNRPLEAIKIPFDPCLLIKSRILVHFLVKLIYGSFWKISSCPIHFVGDLWGL